MEETFGFYYSL